MSDLVKVCFTRNAPPYYMGDVAGWAADKAKELVDLGVATYVEEAVETPPTPAQVEPPKPAVVAKTTAPVKAVPVSPVAAAPAAEPTAGA
jgi:hypothetical protein